MINSTLYWSLIDLDDPEWTESLIKHKSLDEVKDRILYLTQLVDPHKPGANPNEKYYSPAAITKLTRVEFQPYEFGNWRAVQKFAFGGSNIVELDEWFTIIKLSN